MNTYEEFKWSRVPYLVFSIVAGFVVIAIALTIWVSTVVIGSAYTSIKERLV